MIHGSLSDQLSELSGVPFLDDSVSNPADETHEQPGPKPARRKRAKPNPTKAAKKMAAAKDEEPISITLADEKAPAPSATPAAATPVKETLKKPDQDLLLVRLNGVRHAGVVGDLVVTARLQKDGSRFIRMRFDFLARKPRYEVRILPVDDERGPGWISCFHDGKSATALHVYDLRKAEAQMAV